MNPVKFSDPTKKVIGHVWVCSKCKCACHDERSAIICCDHRCKTCGDAAEYPWLVCSSCREKADSKNTKKIYDHAEKVLLSKYDHDYIIFDGDETGTDVESWLEMPDDERPEWAWAVSDQKMFRLDARDLVCLDDMHEDAVEDLDFDTLQVVLDKWVSEQHVTWYREDGRVVLLTLDTQVEKEKA